MTTSVRFGHSESSDDSSGAAAITCSRLSRSTSSSRSPMCSASPFRAPSACEIVSITSSGSRSVARPTQKTPALKSGMSAAAASMASRVFPEPPGPVSVRSRTPPRRPRTTPSSSRSLPTNVLGRTRQVRVRDRLQRRERAFAELEDHHRPVDVLQPVLAEVDERVRCGERGGRCRDEDLAAVTRGREARERSGRRPRSTPLRSRAACPCGRRCGHGWARARGPPISRLRRRAHPSRSETRRRTSRPACRPRCRSYGPHARRTTRRCSVRTSA